MAPLQSSESLEGWSALQVAELRHGYEAQRLRFRRIAIEAAMIVAVLLFAAWWWVPVGEAQEGAGATPVAANDVIDARMEEISRSQDRFQLAVMAMAGVIGTGLVALIGFNFYATNRNVDREAAFLREHAQMSAKQAADSARTEFRQEIGEWSNAFKGTVDGHIEAAEKRLGERVDGEARRFRTEMQRYVDGQTQGALASSTNAQEAASRAASLAQEAHESSARASHAANQARQAGDRSAAEAMRLVGEALVEWARAIPADRAGEAEPIWAHLYRIGESLASYSLDHEGVDASYANVGLGFIVAAAHGVKDTKPRPIWLNKKAILALRAGMPGETHMEIANRLDAVFGGSAFHDQLHARWVENERTGR